MQTSLVRKIKALESELNRIARAHEAYRGQV
jgi:hypothetical protein